MRKFMIAGNWKMNKTVEETDAFFSKMESQTDDVQVVVCPPFTSLSLATSFCGRLNILLGAQNMHAQDSGAYTGEVSHQMLNSLGCNYVILGHSERREYFNESNLIINEKVKKALSVGLKPIFCVGETLSEREADQTFAVIETQIKEGLVNISAQDVANKRLVIAYEPVWAIGTGKVATTTQAQEVHHLIRSLLKELFGEEIAVSIQLLYGGSVKPDNAYELLQQEDIDGALVGGACLEPESFLSIIGHAKNLTTEVYS